MQTQIYVYYFFNTAQYDYSHFVLQKIFIYLLPESCASLQHEYYATYGNMYTILLLNSKTHQAQGFQISKRTIIFRVQKFLIYYLDAKRIRKRCTLYVVKGHLFLKSLKNAKIPMKIIETWSLTICRVTRCERVPCTIEI